MNLTPQQKHLLFAVVDALSKHGSRFTFMRSHSASGLSFSDGHDVRVSADEADLDLLGRKGLVIILSRAPGQLIVITAELTQFGIETAASLRREAAPSTATSNDDGGGDGRRAKPPEELDGLLGNNPFPIDHPCHQLWIDMLANTPQSRGSALADSLVQNRNPFPAGTRDHRIWTDVHEIWTDTNLWAKEHLALFYSDLLETLPPEEASSQEFLAHLLKAEAGTFDIWAGAFSRYAALTDDAAKAFEHLLDKVEEVMMAQASKYRAPFIPEKLFSSELRIRLNQRKQYWTGQMFRKVREHKEASRANADAGRDVGAEKGAVDTNPPVDVPTGGSAETWHMKLRAAREKANLSRTGVANSLKSKGVQITAEAIKKHEEGAAMPRPAVRTAYAAIYGVPENEIFPPD